MKVFLIISGVVIILSLSAGLYLKYKNSLTAEQQSFSNIVTTETADSTDRLSSADTISTTSPQNLEEKTNSSTLPNTKNQLNEIITLFKEELSKCRDRYGKASFCDINEGYIKVAQNCTQFKGRENEDKLRTCAIGFLVPSKFYIADSNRRSTIAVTNNETSGYDIICWDGAEMGSPRSYTAMLYKDFPSGGENSECLSDLQKETIYSCNEIGISKFSACVNGIKKYGEYVPGAGVTAAIQRLDAYMAQ